MRELTNQPLSISEVLRFANHDFMNQLQLIKMNLDLGRVEESKKIIEKLSEQSKTFSNIGKLKLPKTVEWLLTLQWRYPAFDINIYCNLSKPYVSKEDESIVDYLEKTIIHIYDQLDPFTEQLLSIEINVDQETLQLIVDVKGNWTAKEFHHEEISEINIQTIEQSNNSWKYVLTIEQE